MTPDQAEEVLFLLQRLVELVEFFGAVGGYGLGIIWGLLTWHLIIVAKNQSSLF